MTECHETQKNVLKNRELSGFDSSTSVFFLFFLFFFFLFWIPPGGFAVFQSHSLFSSSLLSVYPFCADSSHHLQAYPRARISS